METSCPHMISSTTAAPVVNSSGIVEGLTDASSSWTTSAAFSGIVSTSACGALFRSSLESWLDLLTSTTGAIETADGGCAVPTDFSATPTDGDAASRAWGSTSGTQLGGDDKTFFTSLYHLCQKYWRCVRFEFWCRLDCLFRVWWFGHSFGLWFHIEHSICSLYKFCKWL